MDNLLQEIINFILNIDFVFAEPINGRPLPTNGEPLPTNGGPLPTNGELPSFRIINPIGIEGGIGDILARVISFVRNIAFIIAPIMYLWAGFQYLTSGGDDKKIGSAKSTLIWATVGILIILTAEGIIYIVRNLLTP